MTRADWYATVPENTVRFVRPEHELVDLRQHLKNFFADPDSFSDLGQNGLALYKQQHLPEPYVEKLLSLVSDAIEFRAASAWQKLIVKAKLEAANSFAAERSNADWAELIEWSRLKKTPQVDEAWRQKTNRKASLVYGHTATGSEKPPLIKRLKRFVRLHLPQTI